MNSKEFLKPTFLKILWAFNSFLGITLLYLIDGDYNLYKIIFNLFLLIIGYIFGCGISYFMYAETLRIGDKTFKIEKLTWTLGVILFILVFEYWVIVTFPSA